MHLYHTPKWKWKSLSRVQLFEIPCTIQSMAFSRPEWVAFPFSRGFSQSRDQTQVSCIAGGFFTNWAREAQGSPKILEWVAYPFSSRCSRSRKKTGVSCIVGKFFTSWATRWATGEALSYPATDLNKVSWESMW